MSLESLCSRSCKVVHPVGNTFVILRSVCQGDLLGLLPGRETFVIDKAGKVVLAFNNQVRATLHSQVDASWWCPCMLGGAPRPC